MASGEFVLMVSLDHPEVLENFFHAGSDVVEAFTYNGHREKMRNWKRRIARAFKQSCFENSKESCT